MDRESLPGPLLVCHEKNSGNCKQGWAPLHSAVSAGHEEIAEELLGAGADVNAETSGKRTPLHYAVSQQAVPTDSSDRHICS